ncbi:MAG: hypothetical protein FD151_1861 [bacterium]|nr:MAG: hypothetical protein FD151_1861 [bacterium]
MRIWHKSDFWSSKSSFKWLVLDDLDLSHTKLWANLCLLIKNDVVE